MYNWANLGFSFVPFGCRCPILWNTKPFIRKLSLQLVTHLYSHREMQKQMRNCSHGCDIGMFPTKSSSSPVVLALDGVLLEIPVPERSIIIIMSILVSIILLRRTESFWSCGQCYDCIVMDSSRSNIAVRKVCPYGVVFVFGWLAMNVQIERDWERGGGGRQNNPFLKIYL